MFCYANFVLSVPTLDTHAATQEKPVHKPLIVMNSYKAKTDPVITEEELRLAFPEAQLSNESTVLTISQHCKLSLALGILK